MGKNIVNEDKTYSVISLENWKRINKVMEYKFGYPLKHNKHSIFNIGYKEEVMVLARNNQSSDNKDYFGITKSLAERKNLTHIIFVKEDENLIFVVPKEDILGLKLSLNRQKNRYTTTIQFNDNRRDCLLDYTLSFNKEDGATKFVIDQYLIELDNII